MKTARQLREERGQKMDQAKALVDTAQAEKRELTPEQATQVDGLMAEIRDLDTQIVRAEGVEQLLARAAQPVAGVHTGLPGNKQTSDRDQRDLNGFSLGRTIKTFLEGRNVSGIDAEVLVEGRNEAAAAGAPITGNVILPYKLAVQDTEGRDTVRVALERRDMTATGQTSSAGDQGGLTIATTLGQLYLALYNRIVLRNLGATFLTDMVGNYAIPRIIDTDDPAYKAENGSADESNPNFTGITLTPKRLPTFVEISNQLLLQSEYNISQVVQAGLINKLSAKADRVGIMGSGSGNQPRGILNTTGIGAVYAGGAAASNTNANGAALKWADIVNLLKVTAIENADFGRLGYLSNPVVTAALQSTPKMDNTAGIAILPEGATTLNGMPYAFTNNVPSNLTKGTSTDLSALLFGNFQDLHMCMWGGIDILVNPYAKAKEGMTEINASLYMDCGVARAASFAAIKDAKA